MKGNLRKSSLLLFCAMFFAFAFLASQGLATGRISTETTVSLPSADISVDAQGIPAVLSSGDAASVTITGGLAVLTISNDSDALNALNGGKIKAGSADITTSGDNAVAVFAKSVTAAISSVDIAGHATITTNGTANSVYANDNSEISFGSLDLTTASGDGLQANGGGTNGAVIRVSDYATVTTSGENAIGLFANKSGNISIGGLAKVTTSGENAYGMQIEIGKESSISVGSADITTNGNGAAGMYIRLGKAKVYKEAVIVTNGDSAGGMDVDSGSFKAASLRVHTQGNHALGIHSTGGGASVDITGLAKVTTSGDQSDGMAAADGSVITAGSADVTTSGEWSHGIYSSGTSDDLRSTVDIKGLAKVTTASKDSYGMWAAEKGVIKANSAEISTGGENGLGIASSKLASVDITGLAKVKTDGLNGQGLRAEDGGAITAGSADVTTSGSGAHGILSWGVSDDQRASVDITGLANVSTSGSGAHGLYAQDGGAITAGSADVTTRGSGAYGIWSSGVSGKYSSSVDIKGQAKVLTLGSTQYGLYAESGDITVGGLADVRVANGSSAVYAKNGIIKLNGGASLDVTGDGDVSGIGVVSNGNVFVSGDKAVIKATANGSKGNAYAVYSDGGSVSVDVTGDIEFTASAQNGSASAVNGSNITLKANGQASFDVTGLSASGLYKNSGQNLTVDAVGGSNYKVTATSGDAYGVAAEGTGNILEYGKVNNVVVEAAKGDAYGFAALNGAALSGDAANNIKNITVTEKTADKSAYGVYAYGSGSGARLGAIDNITVNSVGYGYGLYADSSTDLSGAIKDITVNADKFASGVEADYNGKVELNNMTGNLRATAKDGPAVAIGAYFGGKVNVAMNGGDISTETTGTGNSDGITAQTGGSVAVTGVNNITSTGANAFGVYASDSSIDIAMTGDLVSKSDKIARALEAYDNSEVTISSDAAHDIAIDTSAVGNTVLAVGSGGVISFNNANVYNRGSAIADSIMAGGDTDGNGTVNAYASKISGDVEQKGTSGNLVVNLTQSTLTGAVHAVSGASVGLSLDAKSVWNVTDTSNTGGTLNNTGGTVNFYGNDGDEVSKYHTVTVDKLTGQGGVYEMHANIKENSCDQIIANTSDVTGTIKILSPEGKTGTYRKRMKPYLVIVKGDKKSDFRLEVAETGNSFYRYGPSNATEYGAWQFELASEDIDGSALDNASGLATLTANGGGLGWYLRNTMQVSSTAMAVFDSLMAPTIGHLEEGALYSQLGDQDWIASGDRTHVWGYAVYSKFKYTGHVTTPLEGSIDGDNYAENKYYGLTGGIDKVVHECDKGTLRLGAMMGYGEGDLDMDNGDASDNSFHAGVYGIYRFNSGLYLAGIAKYNRYRTDVTARPIEGGSYEASYNQDGFGISALAGKRFELKNSWYVEPQAELGWARIGSASYTINNSDVEIDSTNSVRGRLGFSLGRRVATETGKTLDFYVKASVIREFDGETDLTMSGDPFKADFGGTWGQYKLGVNYWNNDNFMLHGALVYENGENYESPIGVELGLNWFTGPKPQKDEAETTITE